jgi:hypothetical protein
MAGFGNDEALHREAGVRERRGEGARLAFRFNEFVAGAVDEQEAQLVAIGNLSSAVA